MISSLSIGSLAMVVCLISSYNWLCKGTLKSVETNRSAASHTMSSLCIIEISTARSMAADGFIVNSFLWGETLSAVIGVLSLGIVLVRVCHERPLFRLFHLSLSTSLLLRSTSLFCARTPGC